MTLKIKNKGFGILVFCAFCSCEKEEIAVEPHEMGDEMVNELAMEEDYRNQLFFDLGSNSVVSSNLKVDWDIAFESDGEHIILNSSLGMAVHRSTLQFNELISHEGLDWNWDAHNGNLDSTAVGDWQSEGLLYVVDRGFNSGTHQGYFKFKVLSVDPSSYQIEYGEITETTPILINILKSNLESFTYFSFTNGQLKIAPVDEDYDLVFTQYTHLFQNPLMPYLVTGVLLNRVNTEAVLYTEKPFSEIVLEDVENLVFSSEINVIGYDWKGFNFDLGLYTTYPEKVYIIKTWDGVYYKFHFTTFYNVEGLKGFPNIQFQAL